MQSETLHFLSQHRLRLCTFWVKTDWDFAYSVSTKSETMHILSQCRIRLCIFWVNAVWDCIFLSAYWVNMECDKMNTVYIFFCINWRKKMFIPCWLGPGGDGMYIFESPWNGYVLLYVCPAWSNEWLHHIVSKPVRPVLLYQANTQGLFGFISGGVLDTTVSTVSLEQWLTTVTYYFVYNVRETPMRDRHTSN